MKCFRLFCAVVVLCLLGTSRLQELQAALPEGLVIPYTDQALSLEQGHLALWKKAPVKQVVLTPQMIFAPRGGGSVQSIEVQALYNEKHIAFRLRWRDATQDVQNGLDSFRDAVALQFPVDFDSTPAPFMGNAGLPVNIWQWRADWQAKHPHRILSTQQPKALGYYLSPLDRSILKKRFPKKYHPQAACVEFIAAGWGTLTKQKHQDVVANGRYRDGHWEVIFLRDRKRKDLSDARFPIGKQGKVSFAVWNGGAKEAFSRKSILMAWLPFSLIPKKK